MKRLEQFISLLPFTYLGIIQHTLDKEGHNILDVGCGRGEIMEITNRNRRCSLVGVDGFLPYLRVCKEKTV